MIAATAKQITDAKEKRRMPKKKEIEMPPGYSLEKDGDEYLIIGPFCENLNPRIKRIGGHWSGKYSGNRKCFVVPAAAAKSLNRILNNWIKSRGEVSAEDLRQSELDRWLGFVEKRAKEDGKVYERGIEELKALRIETEPKLKERLDKAMEIVRMSELRKWTRYVEKRAEEGCVYHRGLEELKALKAEKIPEFKERIDAAMARVEEVKNTPSYGSIWEAGKAGTCQCCQQIINPGDMVHYRYQGDDRYLEHADCKLSKENAERREAEAPFKIYGGSGYGCLGWDVGQVLKTSERQQNEQGFPEFIAVVEAGSEYYKEDGLCFGVGDDSGYAVWARCREATEEEAAPVRAQIKRSEEISKAKDELDLLKRKLQEFGERPEGQDNRPNGDVYFDTQNLYGGGDWFVVEEEYVWYVQNNGTDGGDWSRNNVRTGGAGAIGWRVHRNDAWVNDLKRLREILGKSIENAANEREMNAMIEDSKYFPDY